MDARKTFVMYGSWGKAISKMTDEQAGKILKAVYALEAGEAPEVDSTLELIWAVIQDKLQEDIAVYNETCKKCSEAGAKGSRNRWGNREPDNSQKEHRAISGPIGSDRVPYKTIGSPRVASGPIGSDRVPYKTIGSPRVASGPIGSDRDGSLESESESESESDKHSREKEKEKENQHQQQPEESPAPPLPPQPAQQEPHLDLDETVLRGMFKDQKTADAMKTWLDIRSGQGPFPPQAITMAIDQARNAETKYGSEKCIGVINDAISGAYKRIIWEKLDRPEQAAAAKKQKEHGFSERKYSDDEFDKIEEMMMARGRAGA